MMSLGTLLVQHGWISKQQLGLAISKQREIGGRLGTCLLEMGAIAEDLLNRSLAEQQGVPSVDAEDLRDVEPKVARLLPAPIAIRYRAIPFRATPNDVDIAMLEVDNLWLQDELSFIVGRRLNVYIANEARIVEALAKYYRAPCSDRFTRLVTRLNRPQEAAVEYEAHPESRLVHTEDSPATAAMAPPTEPPPDSPSADSGAPVVGAPGGFAREPISTPDPGSIPVSVEQLASLGVAGKAATGTTADLVSETLYSRDSSKGDSRSLEEIEVAMETSTDPEEVGRLLLSAVSKLMTRVVLLKVTPDRVRGWLAAGPGLDEQRLQRFTVSFDQPSIFLNLRSGGSFFLGSLPEMPAHLELMECWHKDLADECAVFPVRVRDRLVVLVYGDCGPLGMAELDLDRIRSLCGVAARALERCIVERKRSRQLRVE